MSWRADEVLEKGLQWLDGRADQERPFFLWLHPVDPHHPYEPLDPRGFEPDAEGAVRDAARAALDAQREDHPATMLAEGLSDEDWETVEGIRRLYDAEVYQFDLALGQLVESLKERGLLESTIIVVTSDHGEGLMERPSLPDLKHPEDEAPDLYRRHGLMLHDEQVWIPLVFAGPGVPRGVRRPDWVQHIDVVPTLHGLCDLPVKRPQPGQAMFEQAADPRSALFAVCARSHSVTVDERWRLHLPKEFRRKKFGVEPELYDLAADPDERRPIEDPARAQGMAELIREWEQAHAPVSLGGTLDQSTIDTLRSLGYGGEVERKNLPAETDR
jgi:arylsulfatase A-like enzyme